MKRPPTPNDARERFVRLQELLDIERKAEREESLRALESADPAEREALGRTASRLSVAGTEVSLAGYRVLTLSRALRGEELSPFHAMGQGDNVRVRFPEGTDPAFVLGTIERGGESSVRVAVDSRLPEKTPAGRCSLDLIGSDATYRRMKKALGEIVSAQGNAPARLREILEGGARAELGENEPIEFVDKTLNGFQREAAAMALSAREAALIHGPPGTGKTTVLAEIIRQAVRRGQRVLAGAPSNIAVDNILEKLLPESCPGSTALRLVRLGHPARMIEGLRRANLRWQAAEDEQASQVQDLDTRRERLIRRMERSGGRSMRSEERRGAQEEARSLWREARALESAIERRIVLSAQVVLATHGGLSRSLLRGRFDLVVLDEASQAVEPLSWVALLHGGKAVFAGDSMQLPPTLYSKEAAPELGVTLFDRLKDRLPRSLQCLLRVQYRMHEAIMDFPSRRFYEGRLQADDSVRAHKVCELPGVAQTDLTSVPFVFVDTSGTGYEESLDETLQSRENEGEALLAKRIVESLLEAGLRPSALAVLSPYRAQVRKLRSLLRVEGLEIGTVDGFQGREKEATVVSLVRSNSKGEVGFLSDTRRMNVALTRARRLLIVLGDGSTLAGHPFYRAFIDHAEKAGACRSAWEWP